MLLSCPCSDESVCGVGRRYATAATAASGLALSVTADAVPPLPRGEALAGRFTSYWTPEARQDAKGRALLQRAGPSSYNLSVSADALPPPLVGEALADRATFYWTPEARYGAKARALLQRAGASGQALLVKLLLAWTAEHYRFRDIVLCSSRRKLTDMPMAPPLGELANEVRLRGQGCCQTALHCDSIALTKSLLSAAWRLPGDGLALSVIASQCHLSQRERLSPAGRRKEPPFGDGCSERGGLSDKVPK